ncbi:MAG: GNAT family N-acetyltransferase [Anaerolineales bacterium]|nr:GNAT family N-acetyltransferase [Anaerolineales bacterium]
MTIAEHQFSIRKASLDDVEAISALTDAAYTKYIPLIGRKPQPMTADYSKMVVENSIWLLLVENQLVGVLVLVYEPENILIYSVAINPEYQKQGLGRRLLVWAEEQAVQGGYKSIRLYTNERFEDNILLYKHLGYQETSREPLLNNSTLVHMAKQL